ncbi:hypothetical protein MJO28_000613 [Puccinia striiformis f. sp. tritici]|uniref:Uncharacterized protein n=1 Tax=Puccinia striiformis f. sp. tritici TaxID=168172 RepID=A0ACC0EXP5_9BASI|nr:hypothetical protein Pst134EB_001836 [Puccinia striiformis f. sp. tritici]KAI7962519.1 hypothetical protein MJO28_000613 [Puccinia striiformis f. sp. tritici]KAI9601149.1 hypothetical protein H4Q26_000953 [Puccinia striiformis f. sp. tritici PST-130]
MAPPAPIKTNTPTVKTVGDDEDEWQEMPVIRPDDSAYDEEDKKRFRYIPPNRVTPNSPESKIIGTQSNATGNLLDLSEAAAARGEDWREKSNNLEESKYTRLGLDDDPDEDNLNKKTQYLFEYERDMNPLNQLQATKNLLNEAQRLAYVSMCSLVMKEMSDSLIRGGHNEVKPAVESMKHWTKLIIDRLCKHMDIESHERQMIQQLADHGVSAEDLVECLITTQTVPNPNYDPDGSSSGEGSERKSFENSADDGSLGSRSSMENAWTTKNENPNPFGSSGSDGFQAPSFQPVTEPFGSDPTSSLPWASGSESSKFPISDPPPEFAASIQPENHEVDDDLETPKPTAPSSFPPHPGPPSTTETDEEFPNTLPGISQTISSSDEMMTLDIRWTVLCDLFLVLIVDSHYDARSRVFLGRCAHKLRLSWMDVVLFERRLTEALEVEEDVRKENNGEVIQQHERKSKVKRLVMMGAATIGGGLVIGLSAGLLAPVIGAGLAAGFTTIGIGGTSGFLAGAGGAAVITTAGTVTGMNIAGRGMGKRTQSVTTFKILPLHNNRRVNVFLTMPGFMEGANDDVRLPFSVMDQSMGDVFSILWEPEMMGETGNIIKILTSEVLTQVGQQVLQATVLTALMSALQWPLMLTKLGYLIDNPWSNALARARAAGILLADILIKRHIGVRPVSLIGFSLGARAIFYALVELARQKAYGIVQEVYLLGATVTAPAKTWREIRGVVAGRFVNGYCTNDWILGYLYRATTGGIQTVAGLSPVTSVPGMENVNLTGIVVGHMSYRAQMPVVLAELGFKVTADHFDEPDAMEEDDAPEEETSALKTMKEAEEKKRMIFNFTKKLKNTRPTSLDLKKTHSLSGSKPAQEEDDGDHPPRLAQSHARSGSSASTSRIPTNDPKDTPNSSPSLSSDHLSNQIKQPITFDLSAIRSEIAKFSSEDPSQNKPAFSNHTSSMSTNSSSWNNPNSKPSTTTPWTESNDPWRS